jgi:hypothetical protein
MEHGPTPPVAGPDVPVPAVLAIDVESDARAGRPGSGVRALGFERTVAWLEDLRPRLEDAGGRRVRYAWYVRMDPQVTAQAGRADGLVEAAPGAWEAITAAGDVIGLHTHAGRWIEARGRWVADHGEPAWVDRCLTASFVAYEGHFGRPCREHRFGDRFSSQRMFDRLADLGAVVDLTPEPGMRGRRRSDRTADATGSIPDYRGYATRPHRDGRGVWIMPLTSADPAPAMSPARRWLRRLAFAGQSRARPMAIERAWPSAGLFWDLAERALDDGAAHLAWAIRSDVSLWPQFERVSEVVSGVLRHPLASRLAFGGGEDALRHLGLVDGVADSA